jgi:hypothetical protein
MYVFYHLPHMLYTGSSKRFGTFQCLYLLTHCIYSTGFDIMMVMKNWRFYSCKSKFNMWSLCIQYNSQKIIWICHNYIHRFFSDASHSSCDFSFSACGGLPVTFSVTSNWFRSVQLLSLFWWLYIYLRKSLALWGLQKSPYFTYLSTYGNKTKSLGTLKLIYYVVSGSLTHEHSKRSER